MENRDYFNNTTYLHMYISSTRAKHFNMKNKISSESPLGHNDIINKVSAVSENYATEVTTKWSLR